MKYLKLKYIIGILAVLSLQACKDDMAYDFNGDPNNLVYVMVSEQTLVNTPQNQVNFKAFHTPVGNFTDLKLEFPLRLTQATQDVTASMALDNSLITVYNKKYGTDYLELPVGALTLNRSTVTIKQGELKSEELISLAMDNAVVDRLEAGKQYLAPVKLITVSNGVHISTNLNTVYVKVKMENALAKENAPAVEMLGNLLTNYAGWTYISSNTTSNIANLWNTNANSVMTFNASPATITFNSNELRHISGIRVYSRSATSTSAINTFSKIKFALSKDGINYTEIADFSRQQMRTEGGYQYISMFEPMEAQYIQLELTSPTSAMSFMGVYTVPSQ